MDEITEKYMILTWFGCCLPSTVPCSVTKLWGGGVPTLVSDYSEPRLCRFFYVAIIPVPPVRPSRSLIYPWGIVLLLSCLPTPLVAPPHGIIRPPGIPPSPSQHTDPELSLRGVLCSLELLPYLISCLLGFSRQLPSCWLPVGITQPQISLPGTLLPPRVTRSQSPSRPYPLHASCNPSVAVPWGSCPPPAHVDLVWRVVYLFRNVME